MEYWQRDEDWAVPVDAPAFPPPPSNYHDVVLQSVYFRVEPSDIKPLLPEPLEPSPTGKCCAFAVDVQFCADYGPFKEMGVVVGCVYEGQEAFFLTCLFLDNPDAIAAGREVYGSPKKQAAIRVVREGSDVTWTATRADIDIIQMSLRLTEPASAAEIPPLWPMYVLKVIPSALEKKPAIKQLLQSPAPESVISRQFFKGPGVASFAPNVAGEFWRLRPIAFDGATHQVLEGYTQSFSTLVKDYLAQD